MNRRHHFTLAFALLASATAWACDDGQPKVGVVGTLDGDRLVLREDRFDGASVKLLVFDLAQDKVMPFADLVTRKDPTFDRDNIRAARWKWAQAELKSLGFVMKSFTTRQLPFDVAGATLERVHDSGTCSTTLRAVTGKTKTMLRETACSHGEATDITGLIVTDDKRYVIPMLSSSCLGETADWLHAIPVAKFASAKPLP
jgi:hypothetical protein